MFWINRFSNDHAENNNHQTDYGPDRGSNK